MSRFQGRGQYPERIKKACPECGYEYLRATYIQDQRNYPKNVWQKVGLYCERCHYFMKQSNLEDLNQKADELITKNDGLLSTVRKNIDELNAKDLINDEKRI